MTTQRNVLDVFDVAEHCEVCIRDTETGEMIQLSASDNTVTALRAAKKQLSRYMKICDQLIKSDEPTEPASQIEANEI
ncbi:hypothetical protein [Catenovulum sediminis]|uniref:Uncharacterized protein n=1 Tax=Catenovulum sediminis TaxID=1740262 RepID=A0ABV1RKY9_9ALTE|nr:hypothetical protein [Catenovulum sediminis]